MTLILLRLIATLGRSDIMDKEMEISGYKLYRKEFCLKQ